MKQEFNISKQGAPVEAIFEHVRGYWKSAVIIASIDLKIYDFLRTPKSTKELCVSLQTEIKGTERLLNALVNLQLIQHYEERKFLNTQVAEKYLDSNSPHYIGHIILYHKSRYEVWANLTKSVKTGKPLTQASFLNPDQEQINNYARAMSARAKLEIYNVLDKVNLENCKELLDLGGAPGTFAVAFAKKYPNLTIHVFDLPDMMVASKEITQGQKNIILKTGNFMTDNFGANYCAVFMSQILDSLGVIHVQTLFKKVYDALKQGGKIIIRDFLLDEVESGPEIAIYRNLNVFLTTTTGKVLSRKEFYSLLTKAGFSNLKVIELDGLSDLILGEKKG